MKGCMAIILAGGKGSRLDPLTRDRAKPAVPFGGAYRIIDFTLSNCLNSGIRRIYMLTQYKGLSLDRHINLAWQQYFRRELGEFIDIAPPQQRIDENWYQGTADAVYQNIYQIEKQRPVYVIILAGDHIYKMDYSQLVDFHKQNGAELTIGAIPVHKQAARDFGIMEVDASQRVCGFEEKPGQPRTMPGSDQCLASMGIYVFNARFLFEQLCRDADVVNSGHDFGRDIIPAVIERQRVFAFPFQNADLEKEVYWRDVGTLEAYYAANMDLVNVDPELDVYDDLWPVRSYCPNLPPPKFVFNGHDDSQRCGRATDSIVCQGTIISGGLVEHSIVGHNVRVHSYSHTIDSILFDDVTIERGAKVRNAIVDKHVTIPAGARVGFDRDADRAGGHHVTESGLVVITTAGVDPSGWSV